MLTLLAGIDHRYGSRLGELLRIDGQQVVIAAGLSGCYRFLEHSDVDVDVIVMGVGTGEVFPPGLPQTSTGTALVVLTEPGVHTVPNLPADVTCIERPEDPQELLAALALQFEETMREKDREPE